ncbi:MAG: 50S ribosomal protein L15 [Candidatus Tectomicrobia bacterium]|uniref:Large ribosomal subunit protein uL15 n=1 Tax=Tectimicrobiota bacterium TaxID=2528274 RepID=A0A932FXK9_UNCTE|nr:50S ribosomal protein L15 [Candidatus Tectomicrobia bacterium]
MGLSDLKLPQGARKKRKRIGRGPGSGSGKTAGKGHKGQRARSGGGVPPWFEGGQMPLQRRLPKRGFYNPFKKEYAIVNVGELKDFSAGEVVTPARLKERGLIKRIGDGVKILGEGEIQVPLEVEAHKFSQTAAAKIEAAGGKVRVV